MSNTSALLSELITQQPATVSQKLLLQLPDKTYRLQSNSQLLLDTLYDYFQPNTVWETAIESSLPAEDIYLYEGQTANKLIATTPWQDWAREAGKTGRKDAFYDLEINQDSVRLLHKVKTDMLFIQPATGNHNFALMAFGPTEAHPNQIINFILTQYLNQHLREEWLLGHAAGLQIQGKGMAIAGLSGGGKSTLMLHLLEDGEHFISNDRLLFQTQENGVIQMRGIPKQPRINPGTIVHNPRLNGLMSEQQRQEFLAMPQEELRALEMKFDAPVDLLFWNGCYKTEAPLDLLIILNWSANSEQATQIKQTTLQESPYLIPALMKSSGPFYCDAKGTFLANGVEPKAEDYLPVLAKVPVLELQGKVDFAIAKQLIQDYLA